VGKIEAADRHPFVGATRCEVFVAPAVASPIQALGTRAVPGARHEDQDAAVTVAGMPLANVLQALDHC